MPRRERRQPDWDITLICFVDDDGKPVEYVPDRFQAHYMFVDGDTGKHYVSKTTLAFCGLTTVSLQSLVNLGFSTAEYIDILAYEDEFSRNIQNEEELNALYPNERDDPPRPR